MDTIDYTARTKFRDVLAHEITGALNHVDRTVVVEVHGLDEADVPFFLVRSYPPDPRYRFYIAATPEIPPELTRVSGVVMAQDPRIPRMIDRNHWTAGLSRYHGTWWWWVPEPFHHGIDRLLRAQGIVRA